MNHTIYISVESVAKAVYASSALKSFMASESGSMPPLLTPDNRAAMSVAVRTTAHIDIPDLLGPSCAVCANGDDILEITFDSAVTPSLSLVNTVESMLASRLLARLFSLADKQFAVAADEDACRVAASVRAGLFPDSTDTSTTTDINDVPTAVIPIFC